MANLTSAQIANWQKKIDKSIKTDLVNLLLETGNSATSIAKIVGANGDTTLYQQYIDLNKLTTQAAKQLKNFMNRFDTSLNQYIDSVKKATNVATDETKALIDQFAERASQISKLKM